MTSLRAALVIGLLIVGAHSAGAWIHGDSATSSVAQLLPDPPTPLVGNVIYCFAPDQTLHTTVDAVSYLTLYGNFISISGASVQSENCLYDATISYWDQGTVVLRVVSLGPPGLKFVETEPNLLTDMITVTVTNPGPPSQTSDPPASSDPQPDEVP